MSTDADYRGKWAADASEELPERFWNNRFYRGTVSCVAGPSGSMKSTFANLVAAHVSRTLGPVIACFGEDGESMQRHRLEAAGADMSKVRLADYSVPYDLPELENDVIAGGFVMMILDTAAKYVDAPIHKSVDKTARVMMPLTRLCERTGLHVMLIEHSLKHTRSLANGMQAIPEGLLRTVRTGILFGVDPDDADRRACAFVKDSYGDLPAGMAFRIDDSYEVEDDASEDGVRRIAALRIDDASYSIAEPLRLVATEKGKGMAESASVRAAAAQWLIEKLANGPVPVNPCELCPTHGHVKEEAHSTGKDKATPAGCATALTGVEGLSSMAEADGISWRTIRRASDAIGVVKSRKGSGNGSVPWWRLPDGHPKMVQGAPVTLA